LKEGENAEHAAVQRTEKAHPELPKMPAMTKILLKTPKNDRQTITNTNVRLKVPFGRARVATVKIVQKTTREGIGP
jgi:hypothetical protein